MAMNQESYKKDSGSIEERVRHIEETLPALCRASELASLKQTDDEIAKTIYDIKKYFIQHDEKHKSHESKIDSLSRDKEIHQNTISEQDKKLLSLNDNLSQFQKSVKSSHEELSKSLKIHKDNIDSSLSEIKSRINNVAQNSDIKKEIFTQKEILGNHETQFNSLAQELNSLKRSLSSIESEANKKIQEMARGASEKELKAKETNAIQLQEIYNSLNQRLEDFQNKISSLPKPEIPSLDSLKKEVDAKLEPVLLDSKNAHLRSINNENRVNILEKKLEQALLLLKKYELSQ